MLASRIFRITSKTKYRISRRNGFRNHKFVERINQDASNKIQVQFRFNPKKTIEAAALLLKLNDNKPMKYWSLLKILYLADRTALQQMDRPITGDRYVSMNYGPIPSLVYDLIQGNQALPLWSQFISAPNKKNYVNLLNDPGNEELCEEEEEILEQVYKIFGHLNPFTKWTYPLPEWKKNYGSAIPISVVEILKNVGKSDQEIAEIQQEANWEAYLDGVLNG